MKYFLFALALAFIMSCSSSQQSNVEYTGSHENVENNNQDGYYEMFKELELSISQESDMRSVLDKYRKEIESLRSSGGGDRRSKIRKMRDTLEQQNAEVKDILNPIQYQDYLKIQERNKSEMKKRRSSGF